MADWEIRTVEAGELRVEARGMSPVIRGYAIVYNRLSELLGFFREQIAPEAMTRTLAEGLDLRALVDHDTAKPLGRLKAGSLRVETDTHGLRVEIDPPNTTYGHDIVESIRRGDVTGMSFAFRTMPDGDRWDESATPPIRTVVDMQVHEVSVVTFPAYPQTEVAMRSLEAVRSQAGKFPRGRTVLERLAWTKTVDRLSRPSVVSR
jgi:HK97 family phage prohead protease